MIRSPGRAPAPPNERRTRNLLISVGLGIILLFALVGVISAGLFVGNKVAGGSNSATATPAATSTTSSTAVQNLARAQVQATQIVRTAQQTGRTIVSRETSRAREQAAAILAAARQKAASQVPAPTAPAPPVAAAPPTQSGTTFQSGTTSQAGTAPQSGSVNGTTAPSSSSVGQIGAARSTAPPPTNLTGVPASWLVVGYNATFGSGPGSAGSISVINRSSTALSGVARVVYKRGGVASALFSGLAPGQSLLLPLNGPAYPGGGYSIQVANVR